jgi:hypothetical protein
MAVTKTASSSSHSALDWARVYSSLGLQKGELLEKIGRK